MGKQVTSDNLSTLLCSIKSEMGEEINHAKKKNNHEIISPVPSPNRGISSRRHLEAMNIEAVRFPAMNSNRKS